MNLRRFIDALLEDGSLLDDGRFFADFFFMTSTPQIQPVA